MFVGLAILQLLSKSSNLSHKSYKMVSNKGKISPINHIQKKIYHSRCDIVIFIHDIVFFCICYL